MDFHQLLSKMRAIDTETTESMTPECGAMMSPMSMAPPPPMPSEPPPPPPPSMSVNLNAQGIDNIEQMMKLFQKVNPDMVTKKPVEVPSLTGLIMKSPEPNTSPVADFDASNDNMVGGELDTDSDYDHDGVLDPHEQDHAREKPLLKSLDIDDDGDHDMDDHTKEDGGFQASTTEPDEQYKDPDYMLNKLAGGMNKPQGTYPKVAGGDNPMQKITRMEEDELRSQIRSELQRRLAEAKGAK